MVTGNPKYTGRVVLGRTTNVGFAFPEVTLLIGTVTQGMQVRCLTLSMIVSHQG